MAERVKVHISTNGKAGWYWEVQTPEREIVARGIADTEDQARAAAQEVSSHNPPKSWVPNCPFS